MRLTREDPGLPTAERPAGEGWDTHQAAWERLLEGVRPTSGEPGGSRLVIGVGGTGKTTLVSRLADAGASVRHCGWWTAAAERPYEGLAGLVEPGDAEALGAGAEGAERRALELALASLEGADVLLVDDAHRLDARAVRVLCGVARQRPELALVVAHRPAPGAGPLADLHDALVLAAPPVVLAPLEPKEVAALLEQELGGSVATDLAAAVRVVTGGVPRLVAMLARTWREHGSGPPDDPRGMAQAPPAVAELLRGELERLSSPARRLLVALSLEAQATTASIELAVDAASADLAGAWQELVAAGLVDPGTEAPLPLAAAAVRTVVAASERRSAQVGLARAMIATGELPEAPAVLLAAADARGDVAANVYLAAAEAALVDEPETALDWLARAEEAGAAAPRLARARAEAALRAGWTGPALRCADEALDDAGHDDVHWALETSAAALGYQGQWARSAQAYSRLEEVADQPLQRARSLLLRVPGLLATGDAAAAGAAAKAGQGAVTHAPLHLQACALVAEGLLESCDAEPTGCLSRLLEAVALQETASAEPLLPERAATLAVVVALHLCEFDLARQVLARAGGDPSRPEPDRVRLLAGWTAMRGGDWAEARAALGSAGQDGGEPAARDELLRCALEVGLARRCGTVDQLVRAWPRAREALLRHPIDLFALQPVGELMIAGARVRGLAEIRASAQAVDDLLAGLGDPPLWSLQARWDRLQVAIAADDADDAGEAIAALRALPPLDGPTGAVLDATGAWAEILGWRVDPDAVRRAVEGLHRIGLPWEAARVAGAAAMRCRDPAAMRALLAFARQLRIPPAAPAAPTPSGEIGLSEREREIAGHILAGLTHREIGAQLFISPKTVEHHAASIRRKLGAGSRAELQAALRELLGRQP